MTLILNAFIIALIIMFIKATFWPGMIFEKVGEFFEKTLGEYWNKPVTGCNICMTPYYGTVFYLLFHYLGVEGFSEISWVNWGLTILVAGGFSTLFNIFNHLWDSLKDIAEAKKTD